MGRIKPQALLQRSKKKKAPSQISVAFILICCLIFILTVFFMYSTYKNWSLSFVIERALVLQESIQHHLVQEMFYDNHDSSWGFRACTIGGLVTDPSILPMLTKAGWNTLTNSSKRKEEEDEKKLREHRTLSSKLSSSGFISIPSSSNLCRISGANLSAAINSSEALHELNDFARMIGSKLFSNLNYKKQAIMVAQPKLFSRSDMGISRNKILVHS
uniref:Uncharacterized protein n=1 Tax=Salix viminalis TaxID=40686 RepID=A0A6N2N266_SALVM